MPPKRPPSTASIEKRFQLSEIEKCKQEIGVLGLREYHSDLGLTVQYCILNAATLIKYLNFMVDVCGRKHPPSFDMRDSP